MRDQPQDARWVGEDMHTVFFDGIVTQKIIEKLVITTISVRCYVLSFLGGIIGG